MKKHLYKILTGILFIGAVAAGVVFSILYPVEIEKEVPQESERGIISYQPQDFEFNRGEELHINTDNYFHYDQTTIRGILKEISYKNGSIEKFVIESFNTETYEVDYESKDIIGVETIKDADGRESTEIFFRTGGKTKLIVGEEAMLYKTYANTWSLDEREHVISEKIFFSGKIEDFVFLPNADKEEGIFISHIIVANEQGEQAEIYLNSIYGASIKTLKDLNVYYIGTTADSNIYNVEEGDDYKIELQTRDKTYILKKGMQIDLVQKVHNGYWEIFNETDTDLHKAEIEGFTFGSSDDNIVSLDYINIILKNGEKIKLTMLQTGAAYGVPYGDYNKIYTYFAHEKVLTGIEVSEDWRLELYFPDDIMLELSIGSTVWVHQNEQGIWQLDYTYQEPEEETVEN